MAESEVSTSATHKIRVSSGLKLLGYIETDGTAYIDIGLPLSSNVTFSFTGEWTGADDTDACAIGARSSTTNGLMLWWNSSDCDSGYNNVTLRYGGSGSDSQGCTFEIGKYVISNNGKNYYKDGELIGTSTLTGDTTCSYNIVIFGLRTSDSAVDSRRWIGKCYGVIISNGSTTMNLIPAQYGSHIGLYDTLTGYLYYSTVGTITAGGGNYGR